jgi:hypothetical protein
MTFKVVQGLVPRGAVEPTVAKNPQQTASQASVASQAARVSTQAASSGVVSDAAVVSIRVGRTSAENKIKDPERATKAAKEIAEIMRKDESQALSAHGSPDSVKMSEHLNT